MKTNVYIDGFNLYYGALKGTPYKWLDLAHLSRLMLPNNTIHQIKYFIAIVSARPSDPDQPVRQQTYIRALRTIPNLSIVYGHYLSNETTMRLAHPAPGTSPYVRVIKTEEKGSDVNLATHLLADGFRGAYDIAVVVTNDSDLLEPIKVVKEDLQLQVGVICPHQRPSRALAQHATFMKRIRTGALVASQFAERLADAQGVFVKPSTW